MRISRPLRLAPIALSLVAALLATGCSSKADRLESGLRKGSDLVAAGDWDKASVEVRNVLQIDPKHPRAYLLAGQIDDGRNNFRGAYGNYMRAIELQPDLLPAQLGLARVYLLAAELDSADKLIQQVLATEPANLRGQTLALALQARRGELDAAVAAARSFVQREPKLPTDSTLLLAGLFVNAKDPRAALDLLDRGLAADARDLGLLQMAADIASALPATDGAASARAAGYYRVATEAAPRDANLWRAWSAMHLRRGEQPQAEAVLRQSIQAQPDDAARTLALIEYLAAHQGPDVTEKAFTEAIAHRPKDTTLRFARVEFHRALQRPDEVKRGLDEIVAMGADAPAGLQARGQLAALRLADGDVAAARQMLDEVIRINPRDGAGLLLRGRILMAEGKARDAVGDLRAAAKDRPGAPEVVASLAAAHRAAGEPQLAREVLADAVKVAPEDMTLRLLLADDMAQARDLKAALAEVNEIVRLAPQNARARQMRAQYLFGLGQPAEAEKAAQALIDASPRNPLGPMTLGQLLALQKKPDAALRQFDAAAKLAPGAVEPRLSAVALLIGQKRWADAAARIDAIEQQPGGVGPARQLRGEWALAKGDLALAEQQFQAVAAAPKPAASAFRNLAAVRFARKDNAGGLAALEAGEQAHPKDVMLQAGRAEWLLRLKRFDEAIAIYDGLLKVAPDNETVLNNLAYTLAEAKGDPASLQRALEMASRFETSNQAGQLDTLGFIRYRLGQYEQAAATLERAVALAPNEPVLQLHLGMALTRKGETERGRALLRKVIDAKAVVPQIDEARKLLAQG